jgi:mycothiol system anti-sigma-R factor
MNCDESFEVLYRFLDKDLDGTSCQEVEIHLKICRSCWSRFEFEKRVKEHCHKSCHKEDLPDTLLAKIKSLLEKY